VQPCRGETRIDGKLYLQSRAPLLVTLRGARRAAGTRVKLVLLDSHDRMLTPPWRVLEPPEVSSTLTLTLTRTLTLTLTLTLTMTR